MNVHHFKQYYYVTYTDTCYFEGGKTASLQDLNAWIEYEPEYLLHFST
jgi:hypothetical protein